MNKRLIRFKVMRKSLTGIFLLSFSILFVPSFANSAMSAESIVQSSSNSITINVNKMPLNKVLSLIEKQCDYVFGYNSNTQNIKNLVTANFHDASITQILNSILNGTGLKYDISGRQILIYKQEQASGTRTVKVAGTVTDEKGQPMPGVSVSVKGTTKGTVTNINGDYSLDVLQGSRIELSFIGYKSIEIKAGANSNVSLQPDNKLLSEVVVVGYGTMKKSDLTGSVTEINDKNFNKGVVTSPSQMLQGRIAGINVTNNGGEPGGGVTIRVRGSNSIRSGQDPLWVIDGVPLDASTSLQADGGSIQGVSSASYTNPLNYLNPDDIESISVLKDASAAAIYGSRAANGVILITTKKNTQGKAQVNYSGSMSISYLPKQIDVLSGDEYRAFAKEKGVTIDDLNDNVNWQDEIFRTSFSHNHNISISGGSATNGYRASANVQDQAGIIKTTDMRKYTGHFYVHQDILNNRVHLEGSLLASHVNNRRAPLGEAGGYEGDLIFSALKNNPTIPVYNEDGSYYQYSPVVRNPLAMLNLTNDCTKTDRILATAVATVDICNGLKYKFNYALDQMNTSRRVTQNQELNYLPSGGESYVRNVESKNYLIENYFTYDLNIGNIHKFNFLAGHSYQKFHDYWYGFSENGYNVSNVDYLYNFAYGNNTKINGTSDVVNHELQSFYGRVNYNLMDKYLATVNFRADGSTRFGKNNRYGYFPSVALAWRMSEEDFIKKLNVFDNLKLRLGWGLTGNQEIPDKISELKLGTTTGAYLNGTTDITTGVTLTRTPNPDLKWEKTGQWNAGLDFAVLKGRLSGSIDWYYKTTKDVLLQIYSLAPAPTNTIWSNVKDMKIINKGLEINLNAVLVDNADWTWNFGVNFATNKNDVKNLPMSYIPVGWPAGPGLDGFNGIQHIMNGQPIGTFWGYHFLGFDDKGMSIYQTDADGNKVEKVIGHAQPDFTLNFNTSFRWKNFELSLFFNGVFGNDIYNNLANCLDGLSLFDNGYNITTSARSLKESVTNSLDFSDRYIEDGSYLRLSSAVLKYTVPLKSNKWINGLTLSVMGNNLFCITGYSGYDPEVDSRRVTDGIPASGIGWTNYPMARSFTLGASINF